MDTKLKMNNQTKFQVHNNMTWATVSKAVGYPTSYFLANHRISSHKASSVSHPTKRCSQNDQRGTKRSNLYAVAGYDRRISDRREKSTI